MTVDRLQVAAVGPLYLYTVTRARSKTACLSCTNSFILPMYLLLIAMRRIHGTESPILAAWPAVAACLAKQLRFCSTALRRAYLASCMSWHVCM